MRLTFLPLGRTITAACLVTGLAACTSPAGRSEPPSPAGRDASAAPAASPRPRVVLLGDSLTAGLGLPSDQAYPALIQQRIDAAGLDYQVVNMGVSGDTSAGGSRRLDWALDGDVRVLVVALGGNDGLRGLPVEDLEANLTAIIDRARARGVEVLLCGMEAPPNFGARYTTAFREVYRSLARREGVVFLPFMLDGVAGVPAMNQADGIHPNAEGARRVADLLWTRLEPMLEPATSR
jgi:acyl-CoA thioesterase-1